MSTVDRRMFVGHLNAETNDRVLQEYFGNYGEIIDFIIMRYPDTKRSKCFGFVTFGEAESLAHVLETQPHYVDGALVELKKAVPKDALPAKHFKDGGGGSGKRAATSNTEGRLFVGRLNYDTNDTVLRDYFERFGELTDNVIMRYPDTKRSKGFGFVTFKDPKNMEDCINSQPHTIDGKTVELQRATPREEKIPLKAYKRNMDDDDVVAEALDPEHKLLRKLFIGNMNYDTKEEDIKRHFERYGTLEECVLMKFNDTGRSRGFAFLTYDKSFMVDDCQRARPHELQGKVLEVKRAAPKAASRDPEALANVKKLWVGGFDDNMTDDDVREYFSEFGNVLTVEQVKWHDTGKKRGFGFVEFDDHDPVDKIILLGRHTLKGRQLEIKKALSKQEIAAVKEQQGKMQGAGSAWSSGGDNSVYNSGFSSNNYNSSFMNSMGMMDMIMGAGGFGNSGGNYGSGGGGYGSSGGGYGSSGGDYGSSGSGYGGGARGYGSGGGGSGDGFGGGYMSSKSGSGRQNDMSDSRRMDRGGGGGKSGGGSFHEPAVSSNMEKMIMDKMNVIYENMAAISSITGMNPMAAAAGAARGGFGGGPVRGGSSYTGGARESAGPYARTMDVNKKQYGW